MKWIVRLLLPVLLIACCGTGVCANDQGEKKDSVSPKWITNFPGTEDAAQVLIVTITGGADAQVSMHEKADDGTWREIVFTTGLIGRNGIGKTREGDALTPEGVFHFTAAFGTADDPGCTAFRYHKVTDDDYWSGDQREGYHYNEMVRLSDYPDLDTGVSEHLIDFSYAYQYCLNISWNENGIPGAGSAIFLHCISPGMTSTDGCVAVPAEQMKFIMQRVREDCVVIIKDSNDAQKTGDRND